MRILEISENCRRLVSFNEIPYPWNQLAHTYMPSGSHILPSIRDLAKHNYSYTQYLIDKGETSPFMIMDGCYVLEPLIPDSGQTITSTLRALEASSRCQVRQVGCIITDLLTHTFTGFNEETGPTCDGTSCKVTRHRSDGTTYTECFVIHAEQMAISKIPLDFSLGNFSAWVSSFPCPTCFTHLKRRGIKTIYYGSINPWYEPLTQISKDSGVSLIPFNHIEGKGLDNAYYQKFR